MLGEGLGGPQANYSFPTRNSEYHFPAGFEKSKVTISTKRNLSVQVKCDDDDHELIDSSSKLDLYGLATSSKIPNFASNIDVNDEDVGPGHLESDFPDSHKPTQTRLDSTAIVRTLSKTKININRVYFDPFHAVTTNSPPRSPSSPPPNIDEYSHVAGQYFKDIVIPRVPSRRSNRHSRKISKVSTQPSPFIYISHSF
jgi:hypothetical protein